MADEGRGGKDVNEPATTGVEEAFQKCLSSVMMQFGVYNTIEFPFVAFLVNFRRIARLQKLTLQNKPEKTDQFFTGRHF